MKVVPFPVTREPHVAYITDRGRNSGLTAVRFVGDDRVVCTDFNERAIYLAQLTGDGVEIIDSCATVIADGTAVETDLMDVKDDLIAVTNFYQGSVSFFRIADDRLAFSHEMNTNDFVGIHGVRFVPGTDDLLWVSYCGNNNKCFEIVWHPTQEVIHRVETDEQMQDVAFVDGYALACARTDHIRTKRPLSRWKRRQMYSTVYLYRMPDDIGQKPPLLVDTWRGKGHLDAIKEFDGKAYAANQHLDCVDVFSVQNGKVQSEDSLAGFAMPHGLDVRDDGLLAVTNYLDQTLRLTNLG